MVRLVRNITADGCQGEQTTAFFLHVEKVFDCVWHENLLYKVKQLLDPAFSGVGLSE